MDAGDLRSGPHSCTVSAPPPALFSDPQKRIPKGYPEREPDRDGHSNKVLGVRKLLQEWKRHLVSNSGEALALGLAHFTQRIQAKESLAPDISDCQLPLNALLKKTEVYLFFCVHIRVWGVMHVEGRVQSWVLDCSSGDTHFFFF